MVAHVVLFRPKPQLTAVERADFIAALEHALQDIALIKRARVGRRITVGRQYDQENAETYPFAAILEFEDEAGLRAYLDHPAHRALGEQFYLTAESAMVFDYDLVEGNRAAGLLTS